MDSFYEHPRNAPIPTFTQGISTTPVVPEVSMISQKNYPSSCPAADSMYLTYASWKKAHDKNHNDTQHKNNLPMGIPLSNDKTTDDFLRKQVRFQQETLNNHAPINIKPTLLNLNDEHSRNAARNGNEDKSTLISKSNYAAKPFDKIYLANIPNRKLDLSIINPPSLSGELKENIDPRINTNATKNTKYNDAFNTLKKQDSSKEYLARKNIEMYNKNKVVPNNQKCTSEDNHVIDLYNYKGSLGKSYVPPVLHLNNQHPNDMQCKNNKCDAIIQTEPDLPSDSASNSESSNKADNEFAIQGLLKIIQQQNEQLLILQKQVASLLSHQNASKQIETSSHVENTNNLNPLCEKNRSTASHQCFYNSRPQYPAPQKGPLQKFALDVMTSFEVAIRRPQNHNRLCKNEPVRQPKICEVTETDSSTCPEIQTPVPVERLKNLYPQNNIAHDSLKSDEMSFTLNEPVRVLQSCPTPDPSIQINMDDFSSESESDECTDTDWTFYNNVLGQVNRILKKSGRHPTSTTLPTSTDSNLFKDNIMKKVKAATLEQLKNLGVDVTNEEESTQDWWTHNSNDNVPPNKNDISFAVKQLLMKHLPPEQLAKYACTREQKSSSSSQRNTERTGLIQRRPEFSFATVQYMQKYNLLTDATNVHIQPQLENNEIRDCNKILDITAIKQQPKLL